ncbi:SUF system NifU family Fe-S cluster assembly protein [Demequina sp. SYSU T00192]|uniref:SUF system NifU family Fe-S cluster assembly protein n=1 Tax=Demequina litoralis TaxID=3051660 RepID=A0ABT8GDB6_9MICO|nr:SUF system NifU family Fe-S cluster assembly protein [Demequina sp. SYSU T00192]MDN4476977.1 SUF system NifU family Fe-S cluster assembly protein [Demequina sp. SYSU T00192]
MSLEAMYQQVIMDHAREGHGRGLVDLTAPGRGESHQVNPTCGDEVTMRVGVEGDTVAAIAWEGHGCSISQASISVLSELLEGESLDTADEIYEAFRALMQAKGEPLDEEREDLLGDATAFVGVGKYPARIKCALLGWMAFRDALIQARAASSGAAVEGGEA